MGVTGLCVKGLDVYEISKKLETYLSGYFKGFKLSEGQSLFQEGHMFYFEEVGGMIPDKHHHLFTDDSKFMGMDGFVNVGNEDDCIIAVLMDEQGEQILLLCQCEDTGEGNEEKFTIIKDFFAL